MKKRVPILIGVIAVILFAAVAVVFILFKKESYRSLEIIESFGNAKVYREAKEIDAYAGMKLRSNDHVSIGENGFVRMCFDGDKYVYLEGRALMKLVAEGNKKDSRTVVNLELGTMVTEIERKLSDKSSYEINSPNTTMAIRGTITVSEVRYDVSDSATETAEVNEEQILEYLIEQKTEAKTGSENKKEVEELIQNSTKTKVSSYVQQGKVELTVYEKQSTEAASDKIQATALPLEAGAGISSLVEQVVSTDVISLLEVKDDGTIAVKDEQAAQEILKNIVIEEERAQVNNVEELVTAIGTSVVNRMDNLDDVQLQLNLEEESISDKSEAMLEVWDRVIADMTAASLATPTPSPTPEPTATPTPSPTPEPTATPTPSPTPEPTATPTPSPTPEPTATPIPEPTAIPTEMPVPEVVPSEFTYTVLGEGKVSLNAVADKTATEIVIPGYINGEKVVKAGSSVFSGCTAVKTVRLADDVDPEGTLLIDLITAAMSCMQLREIYLPISYEKYLTEELPLDKVNGITLSVEADAMIIRLQTSPIFLAPQLMDLMQQYQQ